MSKRKRTTSGKSTGAPAGAPADPELKADAAAEDEPEEEKGQEGMAHLGSDALAGSPDIFASKPMTEESEAPTEPAPAVSEAPPSEVAGAPDWPAEDEAASTTADQSVATEPEATGEQAPPPPMAPSMPAPAMAGRQPARGGRRDSTLALGVVLVVIGLFALGVVSFGVDLTQYGWPFFVIIPGVTLLVVGFVGVGAGASIPGGMLTVLGLVLAYQNGTGDWPSWAFVWPLVAPGGVGLGMYLQALRDRNAMGLRRGRNLMFVSVFLSMIGFVFFESILGISGQNYGLFGKAALPILLIASGLVLLIRSAQRSRRA